MQTRTDHLLARAAALYPFDLATLRLIRSSPFSPNDVYSFSREGRAYILRIATHEEDHTDLTAAEMDWLAHLHRQGVPVSMPLPMADGGLVTTLRDGPRYHAVCAFEQAEGALPDRADPASWNMEVCRDWGYTLGRLHQATKGYQPSSPFYRRPVFDGNEALQPSLAQAPEIQRIARELVAFLLSLPRTRDTYGLIHNDFHHTNFFVKEGRVFVFDFDDSMYGHFAMDVGISLYFALRWGLPEAAQVRQSAAEETLARFMEGYLAANPLEPEAQKTILPFMRYRQLCDFGWVFDPQTHPLPEERQSILQGIVVPGVRLSEEMFL